MFRHISRTYSITPQSQFENNSRDTVPLNCPECSDSIHGPNRPRNEKNPPEKKMHGAVKFIGALIVITLGYFLHHRANTIFFKVALLAPLSLQDFYEKSIKLFRKQYLWRTISDVFFSFGSYKITPVVNTKKDIHGGLLYFYRIADLLNSYT